MRDTSFVLREDMESRLVSLASRSPDGSLSAVESKPRGDADFHSGGGGLYSTGPDYLRFTRMLLGGGALDGVRVLAPETVALMGRNAIGDIEAGASRAMTPRSPGRANSGRDRSSAGACRSSSTPRTSRAAAARAA